MDNSKYNNNNNNNMYCKSLHPKQCNVYITAPGHLFHPFKIGRTPYGARLISKKYRQGAVRCPAGNHPMLSYTDDSRTRTIRDHTKNISPKSTGARAILKFACDLQIAEIVRQQFYLWQYYSYKQAKCLSQCTLYKCH